MTSFTIKMIAIISMLVDHTGAILFPEFLILRVIGRLAFPLFAFLITEGFRKTSDVKRYMMRLSIFALISQYPFYYAFGSEAGLNIFVTLVSGLLVLYLHKKYQSIIPVIIIAVIGELLNMDYGAFGIFLIFIIQIYRDNWFNMMKYILGLYLLFYFLPSISSIISGKLDFNLIQLSALFSYPLIIYYNGKRGLKIKYLFYIFYPLHLLILALLRDNIF